LFADVLRARARVEWFNSLGEAALAHRYRFLPGGSIKRNNIEPDQPKKTTPPERVQAHCHDGRRK